MFAEQAASVGVEAERLGHIHVERTAVFEMTTHCDDGGEVAIHGEDRFGDPPRRNIADARGGCWGRAMIEHAHARAGESKSIDQRRVIERIAPHEILVFDQGGEHPEIELVAARKKHCVVGTDESGE